jgi:hypothetical protein
VPRFKSRYLVLEMTLPTVRSAVLVRGLALSAAIVVSAGRAAAQAPARTQLPDMQAIAAGLGVTCEYCHGDRRTPMLTANGRPRLQVAREMIALTAELNVRVPDAAGKTPADTIRVDCVTCHRGVPIPRQLKDIVLEATIQRGPEAAVSLYRELRGRHFGGQSYDFGEATLLEVADRLAQTRPDAAIVLADLNIEFYPASSRSYLARGIAQSRRLDTIDAAVASFKKAIELDPANGVAQGWLIQTEPLTGRRR